jgi:short-subunit dehydrogenase
MTKNPSPTVWILGASSGIGKAVALAYAKKGASLVLSARRVKDLEQTQQECQAFTDHVWVEPMDLSDAASHHEVAQRVQAHLGQLDVLFHSGGITSRTEASHASMDVERRMMEVNYFGVISVTKEVLPMMRPGSGHIVVITSVAGKLGTQFRSAYAASKHALHGWFDSLRLEIEPQGMSVTLVCPGYIATPLTLHALTNDGSTLGEMSEKQTKGMPADVFATRLLKKLNSKPHEVIIGGSEVMSIRLKRWAPALLHAILKRSKVT